MRVFVGAAPFAFKALGTGLLAAGLGLAPAGLAREPAGPPPLRDSLSFRGVFDDPSFPGPLPVRLEVLETGDTLRVTPGEPFRLRLPRDTAWNLCFGGEAVPTAPPTPAGTAPGGEDTASVASPRRLEKCFELRYAGMDTSFAATLGDGPALVILEPPEPPAADAGKPAADSADSAGEEETYRPDDAVQLKKVLVRAQRAPKRSLGKSTVSAKLIKRMPGLAEADVIRSIQALPGVVASSDFSTKIYVRGGGADQNLILLDNAVVYSPVHFFGLFSTFLVEGIDEVNFYKGGFPPEYGNRLSSVLDIRSRLGGKDTADTWFKGSSLKVSTFATQAHTEGRRGPVRWLLAGRGTYIETVLDFLRFVGATDLDLPYFFYDLQGSLGYSLGDGRQLNLSFYQGSDDLVFDPIRVNWGNTVIPLNYAGRLAEDWTTRATASYSNFRQTFALGRIFRQYNRIVTGTYKQSFEYAGIDGHRLAAGGEFNWVETVFSSAVAADRNNATDNNELWLNSLFLQDKWTLGGAEWTSGIRATHSTALPDRAGFEPRLSLKYRLPAGQSLDLHAGYYIQYLNSILFSDQENLNEFYYPAKEATTRTVEPTTSILFSAGYAVEKFREEWDFSLEGYYKTVDHLLVFAPSEVDTSVLLRPDIVLGDLFKEAEGYSLGYEVSLRRPEGLVFGGVSYSSGLSVIREDNGGKPYFPKWHQPHSFKGDLALNWRGKDGLWAPNRTGKYFRSSTQVKYSSGLPFTEYVGYQPTHLLDNSTDRGAGGPNPEFDEERNLIRGNRNADQVTPYFRWDVKAVDWGREGKWNFSFTILNLTNHANVFLPIYDREQDPPAREDITQFPFFPLLVSYEYYF